MTERYEMPRSQGTTFAAALSEIALGLVYDRPEATRSGLSKEEIQALLPAKIPEDGLGPEALLTFLTSVFVPNIRSYRHRLHFGHQRPAPSLASAAADLMNGVTNTTVSVFEAGPVSVALEKTVQTWLLGLFDLSDSAVATFTNGGSESTLTALFCARERWLRDTPGGDIRDAVVVIGDQAHYCIERAARVVGVRPENILHVPADERGRCSVSELQHLVDRSQAEGQPVLCLVANAGTTSVSAFDDLRAFRTAADACGAWLHVDASHGGAAKLVPRLASKVDGLEVADSFAWNPHKMMWVAPPCACLFVRDRDDLARSLTSDLERAHYILDRSNRTAHLGSELDENLEWTLACTRSFSALKVFAPAIAYGAQGIGRRIDDMCRLANDLAERVKHDSRFELFCTPEFNIVCFRYRAQSEIDAFNRELRRQLAEGRDCYLTGAELGGAYWLRAQFTSETTVTADLKALLELVAQTAHQLGDRQPRFEPIVG